MCGAKYCRKANLIWGVRTDKIKTKADNQAEHGESRKAHGFGRDADTTGKRQRAKGVIHGESC